MEIELRPGLLNKKSPRKPVRTLNIVHSFTSSSSTTLFWSVDCIPKQTKVFSVIAGRNSFIFKYCCCGFQKCSSVCGCISPMCPSLFFSPLFYVHFSVCLFCRVPAESQQ